jgi:hypothetical protein
LSQAQTEHHVENERPQCVGSRSHRDVLGRRSTLEIMAATHDALPLVRWAQNRVTKQGTPDGKGLTAQRKTCSRQCAQGAADHGRNLMMRHSRVTAVIVIPPSVDPGPHTTADTDLGNVLRPESYYHLPDYRSTGCTRRSGAEPVQTCCSRRGRPGG